MSAYAQRPTKLQLRQHALDRALMPDVVNAITRSEQFTPAPGSPRLKLNGTKLAQEIVNAALVFEAHLADAAESDAPQAT